MISSIDTYVYNKFKKTINAILKDEKVVDNALARLDDEVRDNFKRAFVGENPKSKIEITYQFPQTKEAFDARLVVQMGKSTVAEESIGSVEGTFKYREIGKVKEHVQIKDLDSGRVGVELEHHIGDIVAIEQIVFSPQDDVRKEGNILSFSADTLGEYVGIYLTVHYIAKEESKEGVDPKGVKLGFTSREIVEVIPLATNMDTARCIDAIIKVVLIIMLESADEKNEYLLQSHSFDEMQNIIPEPMDRLVFGRPLKLAYTVTHSLDFDYLNSVTEFKVQGGTK